jgi:hypothetical protein
LAIRFPPGLTDAEKEQIIREIRARHPRPAATRSAEGSAPPDASPRGQPQGDNTPRPAQDSGQRLVELLARHQSRMRDYLDQAAALTPEGHIPGVEAQVRRLLRLVAVEAEEIQLGIDELWPLPNRYYRMASEAYTDAGITRDRAHMLLGQSVLGGPLRSSPPTPTRSDVEFLRQGLNPPAPISVSSESDSDSPPTPSPSSPPRSPHTPAASSDFVDDVSSQATQPVPRNVRDTTLPARGVRATTLPASDTRTVVRTARATPASESATERIINSYSAEETAELAADYEHRLRHGGLAPFEMEEYYYSHPEIHSSESEPDQDEILGGTYQFRNRAEPTPTPAEPEVVAPARDISHPLMKWTQIYVKNTSGRSISFEVDLGSTADLLREQVGFRFRIPVREIRLVFNGREITDRPLREYRIQRGCTVQLLFRLRGGAPGGGDETNGSSPATALTLWDATKELLPPEDQEMPDASPPRYFPRAIEAPPDPPQVGPAPPVARDHSVAGSFTTLSQVTERSSPSLFMPHPNAQQAPQPPAQGRDPPIPPVAPPAPGQSAPPRPTFASVADECIWELQQLGTLQRLDFEEFAERVTQVESDWAVNGLRLSQCETGLQDLGGQVMALTQRVHATEQRNADIQSKMEQLNQMLQHVKTVQDGTGEQMSSALKEAFQKISLTENAAGAQHALSAAVLEALNTRPSHQSLVELQTSLDQRLARIDASHQELLRNQTAIAQTLREKQQETPPRGAFTAGDLAPLREHQEREIARLRAELPAALAQVHQRCARDTQKMVAPLAARAQEYPPAPPSEPPHQYHVPPIIGPGLQSFRQREAQLQSLRQQEADLRIFPHQEVPSYSASLDRPPTPEWPRTPSAEQVISEVMARMGVSQTAAQPHPGGLRPMGGMPYASSASQSGLPFGRTLRRTAKPAAPHPTATFQAPPQPQFGLPPGFVINASGMTPGFQAPAAQPPQPGMFPETHIRPVAIRPVGVAPAPPAMAGAPIMIGLNMVPVAPPTPFTGERRDWPRFQREALQYDKELSTNGHLQQGARIRALKNILDPSASTRVKTMEATADRDGVQLTWESVMAELAQNFAPRGPAQLRSEIQNLIPRWVSEDPTPIEWRTFAEQLMMLVTLSQGTVSEVELRDHLLRHCLTSSQVKSVIKEERKRGERTVVEVRNLDGWERFQVEQWFRGEHALDIRKVEQRGPVFEVTLRSRAQLSEALALDGAQVLGPAGDYRDIAVTRGADLMSSRQIVDYVTSMVNDSEVVNDTRRLYAQQQNSALAARLPAQRPPSRSSSSHSRDRSGRDRSRDRNRDRGERWPETLLPVQEVGAERESSADGGFDEDQSLEWADYLDAREVAAVEARAAGRPTSTPKGCWNCGAEGHISRTCPTKKCNICKKMGHSAVVCPTREPPQDPPAGAAPAPPPAAPYPFRPAGGRGSKGGQKGRGGRGQHYVQQEPPAPPAAVAAVPAEEARAKPKPKPAPASGGPNPPRRR